MMCVEQIKNNGDAMQAQQLLEQFSLGPSKSPNVSRKQTKNVGEGTTKLHG